MKEPEETSKASEILRNRYIGESIERKASLEVERVNAEVAHIIYELRREERLTQKELADMIGTTQSVISRLEDADYEGHSLSMLTRIVNALGRRLTIRIASILNEEKTSASLGLTGKPKMGQTPAPLFSNNRQRKGLRPGQIAPLSGQYQQIGPRGGLGKQITITRGEPLPPTPKKNMTYNLVSSRKEKSYQPKESTSVGTESKIRKKGIK